MGPAGASALDGRRLVATPDRAEDDPVKVSITKGGTMLPVLTTTELDDEALSVDDTATFRSLVEKAGVGTRPPPAATRAQPDRGGYSITIDDTGKRSTTSIADADLEPDVRALVDFVDRHPEAVRRTEPLGG